MTSVDPPLCDSLRAIFSPYACSCSMHAWDCKHEMKERRGPQSSAKGCVIEFTQASAHINGWGRLCSFGDLWVRSVMHWHLNSASKQLMFCFGSTLESERKFLIKIKPWLYLATRIFLRMSSEQVGVHCPALESTALHCPSKDRELWRIGLVKKRLAQRKMGLEDWMTTARLEAASGNAAPSNEVDGNIRQMQTFDNV